MVNRSAKRKRDGPWGSGRRTRRVSGAHRSGQGRSAGAESAIRRALLRTLRDVYHTHGVQLNQLSVVTLGNGRATIQVTCTAGDASKNGTSPRTASNGLSDKFVRENVARSVDDDRIHRHFPRIITQNRMVIEELRYAEIVARTNNPILITGESGVGKELLAQAIHRLSGRQGDFVCENIAGLDDAMLSDALFGHVRGAFTGAQNTRRGLIEEASGGTLFLDEVGDMALSSQVKLLRFLEQHEYRPLGADRVHRSDARVILATNANLEERLEAGAFRKDLFYRLEHRIDLPPLRVRIDDLPWLVQYFVERIAGTGCWNRPEIPPELLLLLGSYDFPGNIRELRNMIENAFCLGHPGALSVSYLTDYVSHRISSHASDAGTVSAQVKPTSKATFPTLREMEEYFIQEAIRQSNGKQNAAAGLLGLSPSALSRRVRNYHWK